MSNRTERLREALREVLWWIGYLAIPLVMIIWPFHVVRTLRDHRSLARLKAAGKLVKSVEPSECGWRLQFADGLTSELRTDEVRRGTWYEFENHRSGMAQTTWETILTLDLPASATLIVVGPVSDGQSGDPLAELRKVLVAAGRLRGPVRRNSGSFPDLLDMAMILFWVITLFVLAIIFNGK